jgi:tRNA modification GTPase
MLALDDTIAAVATPVGEGGIGIVRLSGPLAGAILTRLFSHGSQGRHSDSKCPDARRISYGHVCDPDTHEQVDEVLTVFMPAPHTYTRQDVAEIHCHGGVVALRRTIGLALRCGARLAQPGEFTLRAFLNGRIDLAQAEAVLDIVHARTEAALRIAEGQLEGRMSQPVRQVRRALLDLLASLEASLDFPEEEIGPPMEGESPAPDLAAALEDASRQLVSLLSQADEGMMYRQGARAVIVGRPNVGKSSLLNALLHYDRAIVTPIPGTTRDTVEETLNLSGVPFCLVDTAGIVPSQDPVERMGIERSRRAIDGADVVLFVLNGSEPLRSEDCDLADIIRNRPRVVVVNKSDLPQMLDDATLLPEAAHIHVSALLGTGLAELEQALVRVVLQRNAQTSDLPLVSNPRHREVLRRALASVGRAIEGAGGGVPDELLAVDLTAAVSALGEITGESVGEDVLATIFSSFCVGK